MNEMAESHVVSSLISKRAELLGQIEAHQKEIQRISEMLLHVDHTIKLFSPEFDLRSVKSKHTKTRPEHHKYYLPDIRQIGSFGCEISFDE